MFDDRESLDIYVATYLTEEDAQAAYERAHISLHDESMLHTYDVAVLTKDEDGKPKIITKHTEALGQGAKLGGLVGVAGGLLIVLFPPAGIGMLLSTIGVGAAMGAISGKILAGMSRKELAEIGESLDETSYALILATDWDDEVKIGEVLAGAVQVDTHKLAK